MNLKLKVAAAAVGLALGAQAQAITLPGTGNGELFLTVWDPVRQVSYSRGLDVLMNDFLPSQVNPNPETGAPAGTRTPEAGVNLSFAGDSLFNSTFATSMSSNIRWNIAAADNAPISGANRTRALVTGQLGYDLGTPYTNAGVTATAGAVQAFASALNNNWGCGGATDSCATVAGVGPVPGDLGFGGDVQWGERLNNTLPSDWVSYGTGFGSSLGFFYFRNNGTGALGATELAFANSANTATWTLEADGDVVYSLAAVPIGEIPEPSTYALMLAGLLGLGAIARRRTRS